MTLNLSIERHTAPIACERPGDVVYDIAQDQAFYGTGSSTGPALRWRLGPDVAADAMLHAAVDLDAGTHWIVRCDRVDFPPGSVAYRHTHPGPGIRCTLFGGLTIDSEGHLQRFGQYEAVV